MDGKRSAWYQDGRLMSQGSAVMDPAGLTEPPVTPARVIARIEAAVLDEDRRGPRELNGHVPPRILFMEIDQLLSVQWLAPGVRAALFRALPAIKGVTMTGDVPVADGRRGVAFSLTDDGARQSLVLDPPDLPISRHQLDGAPGSGARARRWPAGGRGEPDRAAGIQDRGSARPTFLIAAGSSSATTRRDGRQPT